jgi:hypothetical protein
MNFEWVEAKRIIMQMIEIDSEIDANGEIHTKLSGAYQPGPVHLVVFLATDQPVSAGQTRHRPSPRLAGKGAKIHGDDMAPAFTLEEWGDLYR